jgi:hypothetical protein
MYPAPQKIEFRIAATQGFFYHIVFTSSVIYIGIRDVKNFNADTFLNTYSVLRFYTRVHIVISVSFGYVILKADSL